MIVRFRKITIYSCKLFTRSFGIGSLSDPNFQVSEGLSEDIKTYAKKKQTDISLRTLLDTGQGKHLNLFHKMYKDSDAKTDDQKIQIQIANFLHRELPV